MIILFLIQTLLFTPTVWQTDFEQAKALAKEQDKSILMVFSGSDWCAPCKKLKKQILSTVEFSDFEKENLIVLYLDFPAKKKNKLSKTQTTHNEELAEQYNSSGQFPQILLLSSNAEIKGKLSFENQSAESFITQIKGLL
jgi:thioredoxin-related protein